MFNNLTICVPAYNESGCVGTILIELVEQMPGAQIIVVDDGSSDNTWDEIKDIKGILPISHPRNIGYGGALKTALRKADRPVVVWFDADGQHRIEDLKKVIKPVLADDCDAVIGVREKGSDFLARRMPGKMVLKVVAEMVAMQKIPDLNSGMRCFKTDVIRRYMHLFPNGFSTSTTSTLLMLMRGYRVQYVGIKTRLRIGESSVRMFSDGMLAIQTMLRILVLFKAMAFFSCIALILIITGLIYGFIINAQNLMGFPVLTAVLIISGVLTFFMGLICDQIVCMRKERFEDFQLAPVMHDENSSGFSGNSNDRVAKNGIKHHANF